MNILVTGGAGYIGSACAAELQRLGHQVFVYDNFSTGHRAAVPGDAGLIEGDIADVEKVSLACRTHRIEAAMHFAASALIDASIRDPAFFYRNNVTGTLGLLDALVANGITRLVFSSTAAVYGEPQASPITEDHPTLPVNAYGDTKLAIERALSWYQRAYGLNAVALRYFSAAGATELLGEDHRPETHLLPRLLDAAMNGKTFEIYGDDYNTPDGTCVRDFVHVLDIAQAHILALDSLERPGFRIYNVGSGHGFSIQESVRVVEDVAGAKIAIRRAARRPGDPAVLVAGARKLREELGWAPRYSDLPAIVSSAWKWRRMNPQGYSQLT